MSAPVSEHMTKMPHSVGHNMTLETAREMMKKYNCHHLPVLDGGKLVGIISDRDLRAFEKFDSAFDIIIEEIMTDEPVVVTPSEDVFQVAMLMQQKKIGSVIVSGEKNHQWGIFTATDALKFLTENHSH